MMIEIMPAATFDPATLGAITSLDYQEDQLCSSAEGCVGGGQNWFPTCVQNGIFYIYNSGTPTGVVNTWTAQSVTGLTAADFAEVDLSATGMSHPNLNPDFSARIGRIDNWSVTISESPVAVENRSWGYAKSTYR